MKIKRCLVCNTGFQKGKNISLRNWKQTKFCCKKCYWKYLKEKPTWNKGLKIDIETYPNWGHTGKKHTKQSRKKMSQSLKGKISWNKNKKMGEAFSLALSKRMKGKVGEKAHNWKGGITPLVRLIRNSIKYKEWVEAVKEKNSYICHFCESEKHLEVDHLIPLQSIIKENKITSSAEAYKCKALWNISNGRTLCVNCHYVATHERIPPINGGWIKKYKI